MRVGRRVQLFKLSLICRLLQSRGLTQGAANVFNGLGMGLGGPVGGLVSDW